MPDELTPEERRAWAELARAEQALRDAQDRVIAATNRGSSRRRLYVIEGGGGEARSDHAGESVA